MSGEGRGTLAIESHTPVTDQAAGSSSVEEPRKTARIVVYGNPDKKRLPAILCDLAMWVEGNGLRLSVAREISPALEPPSSCPVKNFQVYQDEDPRDRIFDDHRQGLLVSLGGDGTLIRAVRRFWPLEVPVLSVNLGSLGFNASVEPERVIQALEAWRQGASEISERMAIQVSWVREGQVLAESMAVNDVVLVKHYEARMIHFILSQGEHQLTAFAADGLIVATPTGSTAYNLSAGGPIVYPSLQALIATAICPHTLAARPMILPPSPPVVMEFTLRHSRDQAMLWLDGQERWPIIQGDRVVIEAAKVPLRLISHGAGQYFATLRRKLCWSGEFHPKNNATGNAGPNPSASDPRS